MREIIEIDKDFNLNTVKHSKKVKPNSKIKGKVNISLYDKNNNLVRDIHTENLVMDWFKDETYERGFVDLIGRNTYKDTNLLTSPFSYLILSDQDVEEDSKNPFVMKNTIGYVQRRTTYSGTSATQGTYNANESWVKEDEEGNLVCHEVYDFQTHASNGDIKSLMWVNSLSKNNVPAYYKQLSYSIGEPANNMYFDFNNKTSYCFANQNYFFIVKDGASSPTTCYMRNASGTSMSSSSWNQSYCISPKDNKITGACYNTSSSTKDGVPAYNFAFGCWDLKGYVIDDKFKTYSSSNLKVSINGEEYVTDGYATYDGEEYIYYTIAKSSDKNYKGIVKANFSDGSLIKHYLFETSCVSTNSSIIQLNTNGKLRFLAGNTDCYLDKDLNILKTFNPVRPMYLLDNCENGKPHYNYNSGYSRYGIEFVNNPVTTYVKLPQTITKTNTNTMKIQYDFVIENPKALPRLMGGI